MRQALSFIARTLFTVAFLFGALVMLSGCNKEELPRVDDPTAVCKALLGPIKYNTQNPKSRRHAGDLLGLDLKQRNQIGQQLGCPQFR